MVKCELILVPALADRKLEKPKFRGFTQRF